MILKEVIDQAKREIEQEEFRAAVENYKKKLRERRSIWDRLFPFKIIIVRKGRNNV